jgi:small subunit ribosomal protein S18
MAAPSSLPKKNFNRKKACKFCTDKEMSIDYKDYKTLNLFLTERSKIVPRRISGNCAFHQRELTNAVKRSRTLALVGFVATVD